jgi:hypothetical protein
MCLLQFIAGQSQGRNDGLLRPTCRKNRPLTLDGITARRVCAPAGLPSAKSPQLLAHPTVCQAGGAPAEVFHECHLPLQTRTRHTRSAFYIAPIGHAVHHIQLAPGTPATGPPGEQPTAPSKISVGSAGSRTRTNHDGPSHADTDLEVLTRHEGALKKRPALTVAYAPEA